MIDHSLKLAQVSMSPLISNCADFTLAMLIVLNMLLLFFFLLDDFDQYNFLLAPRWNGNEDEINGCGGNSYVCKYCIMIVSNMDYQVKRLDNF